jgi:hypothetical protein
MIAQAAAPTACDLRRFARNAASGRAKAAPGFPRAGREGAERSVIRPAG